MNRELRERLQASLGDAYTLQSELAGGMSRVFVAEERTLGRRVVIKVLPPELSGVVSAERFRREIHVIAALHHPHIVPLLSACESGGLLYYTMPFVEGESLRARLARERQLPIPEALRIARETADALDYAHRHDVIHRDIKPENVLLVDDHALLADFGIARAISRAGASTITTSGMTLGTPAYMSPEQAMAEPELDGRSDIFSLGCVLYEMLAGEPPFHAPNARALIAHLVTEPAPRVNIVRESVTPEIEQLLDRALAKLPADRFQTAGELRDAIDEVLRNTGKTAITRMMRAPSQVPATAPSEQVVHAAAPRLPGSPWHRPTIFAVGAFALGAVALLSWKGADASAGAAAVSTPPPWILVADFDGPSDDPRLADAARELVVSGLDESRVATSVPRDQMRLGLQLAGRADTVKVQSDLARELAVRGEIHAVVTGRMDRVGTTYSLLVRVVDADSGTILVTRQDVARGADEVVPTAMKIGREIAAALNELADSARGHPWLPPRTELSWPTTTSLEAYLVWQASSRMNNVEAVPALHRAIALDSGFYQAWRSLGVRYRNLAYRDSALWAYGEARRRPRRLTEFQKLELDALEATARGDWEVAVLTFDRILTQYPTANLNIHNNRAVALDNLGRWQEALTSLRTALARQPFGMTALHHSNLAVLLMKLGRWDDARGEILQMRGSDGMSRAYWAVQSLNLAALTGDWDGVEQLARQLTDDPSLPPYFRGLAATALASARAARGALRGADSALALASTFRGATGANPLATRALDRSTLVMALASGRPTARGHAWAEADESPSGRLTRALRGALVGDTLAARSALDWVRTLPPSSSADLREQSELLTAMLAASEGRWQEVARTLKALADTVHVGRPPDARVRSPARWLVGDAYAHLARPDSAVRYFELLVDPIWAARDEEIPLHGLVLPYAHQRLVLLYAGLGRVADAQRHLKALTDILTEPDPELSRLVQEARAAVDRAARAKG